MSQNHKEKSGPRAKIRTFSTQFGIMVLILTKSGIPDLSGPTADSLKEFRKVSKIPKQSQRVLDSTRQSKSVPESPKEFRTIPESPKQPQAVPDSPKQSHSESQTIPQRVPVSPRHV